MSGSKLLAGALACTVGIVAAGQAQTPQAFVNQLQGYLGQYSGEFLNSGYATFGAFQTGQLNDDGRGTHTANLTAGTRYAIVAVCDQDCTDLDLSLAGPGGAAVGSDYALDDHPTLRFVAPMTGTYTLTVIMATCSRAPCYYGVQLYGAGGGQPTPIPQPISGGGVPNPIGLIAVNQQVSGNLSYSDPRYDNKPMQTWGINCVAGQSLQIDVLSQWDNYAYLFDPMGNVAARDDDTGESLNARITYVCPMAGTYRIGITAYSTSTTPGPYTLQVQGQMVNQPTPINQPQPIGQPQPMPTQPMVQPNAMVAPGAVGQIMAGQTLAGRLEPGDRVMTDSTWADLWQFQGQAGQMVTIELRSAEFDTYLQLLDANNNRLAEDDDSLGDLDSRIMFRLPSSGTFQIVVNNIGDTRRAGMYSLTLR